MTDRRPNKWVVVMLVAAGLFMALLDTTIVDITLPRMMPELNTDLYGIQWVIIAYFLGSAIAITLVAWLGDRLGYTTTYILGMVLFTAMSAVCGLAPSLHFMEAGRFLQGVGEGILLPVGLSIMYAVFPREEHGLAIGIFGVTACFAPAVGPVLGGFITAHLHWRWVFYVNLHLGALDLVLIFLLVPNIRTEAAGRKLDLAGFGLLAAFLVGLIVFTGKGQPLGWLTNDFVLRMALLALAGFAGYAVYIRFLNDDAILPLRLFRDRNFSLGLLSHALATFNIYGVFLLQPLLLQRLHGYSTIQSGLILFPSALVMAFMTLGAGILSDKLSPKVVSVAALVLTGLAGLMLRGSLELSQGRLVVQFILWAMFIGASMAPGALVIMGGLKEADTNTGSAALNMTRLVAGSIGTAYATAILTTRTGMFYDAIASRMDWGNPLARLLLTGGPEDLVQGSVCAREVGRVAMASAFDAVFLHLSVFAFLSAFVLLFAKSTAQQHGPSVP